MVLQKQNAETEGISLIQLVRFLYWNIYKLKLQWNTLDYSLVNVDR